MLRSFQILGALLLSLCITLSCLPVVYREDDPAHGYLRFPDVRRQCQPVLSAAGELGDAVTYAHTLKRELSFEKGKWGQDAGGAPLMPFDGGDVPDGAPAPPEPLHLANFALTHVDAARRGRSAVNVTGVLVLSISRKSTEEELRLWRRVSDASPEFELLPGTTKLKILFQGVYTEAPMGGGGGGGGGEDGERVLCMVGTAFLPTRSTGAAGRSSFRPPLVADGNIVLVLRYPRELTLTTRAVRGEMRSTNAAPDAAYFDTVRVMSRLAVPNVPYDQYQFVSDELVAAACSPWPSGDADAVARRSGELHAGVSICEVLNRFAYGSVLTVVPDEASEALGFHGDAIALQEVQCRPWSDVDGCKCSARVSAVLRVLSPREHRPTAAQRTDLDGATLAAEGVWKATAGQACMVGCRGGDKDACRYRVCLYVPTTFSITRRSIMLGRITGIDGGAGDETAGQLLFEQGVPQMQQWGQSYAIRMAYNYTKLNLAGEFRRRSASPSGVRDIVARSLFLSYPREASTGDVVTNLFKLADELTLRFTAVPDLFPTEWLERPVLQLEMLAVEQAVLPFTRRSSSRHESMSSSVPGEERAGPARRPVLNVAAELKIVGKPFGSTTALSLEGLYTPEDGRMYLIGCRTVRSNVSTSRYLELEEGRDCSIEVKVEYSPTTAHGFISSTATVHIASTRVAGDPLHFSAAKLTALPVLYRKRWRDAFSQTIINGVIFAAALSAAIAALRCQLRHLRSHADVTPYVSDAMLTIQYVGYGLALIIGFEEMMERVTFGSATPPRPPASPHDAAVSTSQACRAVDKTARCLALAALLLTHRVGRKVRRSRARMPARSPAAGRKVLVCSCAAHLAVFLLASTLNGGGHAMTVEQLLAVAQDLFLLPQVIGNAVWRVNCKPLAAGYYLGTTAARVLPHVYGYVRPPPVYPHSDQFADEYFVLRKPGDLVVPLVAVVLALVVYVQQRWNYVIVSWMSKSEQNKLHTF